MDDDPGVAIPDCKARADDVRHGFRYGSHPKATKNSFESRSDPTRLRRIRTWLEVANLTKYAAQASLRSACLSPWVILPTRRWSACISEETCPNRWVGIAVGLTFTSAVVSGTG